MKAKKMQRIRSAAKGVFCAEIEADNGREAEFTGVNEHRSPLSNNKTSQQTNFRSSSIRLLATSPGKRRNFERSLMISFCWLGFSSLALGNSSISFAEAAQTAIEPIQLFISLLHKICWIVGGAFVVGSVVQYLQYRKSPTQVPISKPVLLGLLGLLLMLLPFIAMGGRS